MKCKRGHEMVQDVFLKTWYCDECEVIDSFISTNKKGDDK